MKILPFRKRGQDPDPSTATMRFNRFAHARELAEYGFDGATPIRDETSSSGFLLPWIGIDAEADRRARGGHCELVVSGEYVDDARHIRHPILEVNPAWMRARGYTREIGTDDRGRPIHGPWHKNGEPA